MSEHRTQPRGRPGIERRLLLKLLAAAGVVGGGNGLCFPAVAADAKGWPRQAFSQKTETDALGKLFGTLTTASGKFALDVPQIAQNGAVVPVSVTTDLKRVSALAILVPGNPNPLAAYYTMPPGTEPFVSCRLKIAKTSEVVAVAEADGKLYRAARPVKVTVGGCGG